MIMVDSRHKWRHHDASMLVTVTGALPIANVKVMMLVTMQLRLMCPRDRDTERMICCHHDDVDDGDGLVFPCR